MGISAILLNIALKDIKPKIFRRILVPPNYSLLDLHHIFK